MLHYCYYYSDIFDLAYSLLNWFQDQFMSFVVNYLFYNSIFILTKISITCLSTCILLFKIQNWWDKEFTVSLKTL